MNTATKQLQVLKSRAKQAILASTSVWLPVRKQGIYWRLLNGNALQALIFRQNANGKRAHVHLWQASAGPRRMRF